MKGEIPMIEEGDLEPLMISKPEAEEVLELTSYMDNKTRAEVANSLFPSELEMNVRTGLKVMQSHKNGVVYNVRNK
jgi:hypothetical protein